MQINLLPQIFNTQINNCKQNNKQFTPRFSNELTSDTVSFTSIPDKVIKKTAKIQKTVMKDVIRNGYESNIPQYTIHANRLMDALESIAIKYKDRGVRFDREYCQHASVKSSDSFISKLIRSGESSDRIRSTLYMDNPHDFKLLNEILVDLDNEKGYKLANIPGTKKPDFDIRLSDVTEKELKGLRADLQKLVSGPLPTGYEDIQLRLKDKTNKRVPLMEVIILAGRETANAKIDESKYSYNIRRVLKKVLNAAKVEEPQRNTPAYRIKNNIKMICDTLVSSISKPLFINARNADYLHTDVRRVVGIAPQDCETLKGLAEGIQTEIPKHYSREINKIKSKRYEPTIIKLIKESSEYQERADKTIYAADIIEKRNELLTLTRQHEDEDVLTILKIKSQLAETIKKYNLKPQTETKV